MPGSDKRPNKRARKVRPPQPGGDETATLCSTHRASGYCSTCGLEPSVTSGEFSASLGPGPHQAGRDEKALWRRWCQGDSGRSPQSLSSGGLIQTLSALPPGGPALGAGFGVTSEKEPHYLTLTSWLCPTWHHNLIYARLTGTSSEGQAESRLPVLSGTRCLPPDKGPLRIRTSWNHVGSPG